MSTNVEGQSVSPNDAKPVLPAVFYSVGDEVMIRKIEWISTERGITKADAKGVVQSITGDEGHSSVYRYIVRWSGGLFCTDNLRGELYPVVE